MRIWVKERNAVELVCVLVEPAVSPSPNFENKNAPRVLILARAGCMHRCFSFFCGVLR